MRALPNEHAEKRDHMSTLIAPQEPRRDWETPPATPLNETVWQKWLAKGRARDVQHSAFGSKVVKLASIAGLLAIAGLWSQLIPYADVVRFAVTAAAIAMIFQAVHARRYPFAVVFGALALLFNPLAPVFSFAVDWHRVLVIVSAVPFIVALTWRTARSEAQ
jgi:hypothetical protein